MTWDDARIQQLLRLHRAGLSQKVIAVEMGLRHDQVESKCHRLGLTQDCPGQPNKALIKQRRDNRRGRESKPKPKLDVAPRKCLGCLKTFRSEHKGNRVCRRCKDTAAWKAGEDLTYGCALRGVGTRAGVG